MTARARLLPLAAALAVVLGAPTAAAPQTPRQQDPDPNVRALLERFPLGDKTVTEEAPPTRPPANTFTLPTEDTRGTEPAVIAASIGTVLVLMAVGAGVLAVRRRRSAPDPVWSSTPNLALLYQTLASTDRDWKEVDTADHSTRRKPPVTEVSQDRSLPQEAAAEPGSVVEHISAILQSAEAAAAAIRQEAMDEAEEIKQAAVREGQAHLARVKEEAARIRNDAEEAAKEAQSAAETFGANQRRDAERVQQMLAEAEAQARATRQAAEQMAQQIDEALVKALRGSAQRAGEWEAGRPPEQRNG